jgi:ribosomal protein L3 glutamine methyltransferase
MPHHTLQTPRDCLRYAVSRFTQAKLFFGHGNANAFDEAAYLILHTLHLPLEKLEPFLDARLLPSEIKAILDIFERRISERVPAAYLTKEAWLQGYRFYVDERCIVPRSFISELIPLGFSSWVEEPENMTDMLDLCTGSACLPIMLADVFPQAKIDAADISPEALEVAKINVNAFGAQAQITLHTSDLFAQLPAKKYDLIISNPPYVNSDAMRRLPQEFLREPTLALAGGADGMDIVRRILQQASDYLKPQGVLVVEVGNERAHVEAAWPNLPLTWVTTSAGDDMVFLIRASELAQYKKKNSL